MERHQRIHQRVHNTKVHLENHRKILHAEADAGSSHGSARIDNYEVGVAPILQNFEQLLQNYRQKIDELANLENQRQILMNEDGSA